MEKYTLKDGREVIIRTAQLEEAEEFLNYLNACGKETDFLGFGKEGIDQSIEDEQKYFKNFTPKNFMLVACVDGKIVGSCSLKTNESRIRFKHIGVLGIAILKEYWSLGIGTNLISSCINRAKKAGITRVELFTRTDNAQAISLYEKLGFEIEGKVRNAALIDNEYFDNYLMGLLIK